MNQINCLSNPTGSAAGAKGRQLPIPVGQLATPVLAAAFGTAAVAVTGGGTAAVAMLMPLLVPALRRIEINRNAD